MTTIMLQRTFMCLFLLVFPALRVTFACRCMQPTVARALDDATSSIFTGTVRQQKVAIDPDRQQILSILSVDRIIKGCSLKTSERIVVTTASSSAGCGVYFQVNETYVLTGEIQKLDTDLLYQTYGLKFKKPINSTVHASSCSFTMLRRDVSVNDRKVLSNYGKENPCPDVCNIGTDCPRPDDYCDSGICRSVTRPCPPPIRPRTPCFVDPCNVTQPSRDDLKCTKIHCGICQAVFTDANRTRTCHV